MPCFLDLSRNVESRVADLFALSEKAPPLAHSTTILKTSSSAYELTDSTHLYAEILRDTYHHHPVSTQLVTKLRVATAQELGLGRLVWSDTKTTELDLDAALAHSRYKMAVLSDFGVFQVFDTKTLWGLQIHNAPLRLPPWESGSPLRNFIAWSEGCRGKQLLHAAVIAWQGEGALIAGDGGAGKSGTVLASVMQGFETVGDDYVVIDGAAPFATEALFTRMKQDADGLARTGFSWSGPQNWQGKFEFPISQIREGALCGRIAPVAIIVPRIRHTRVGQFDRISSQASFLCLVASNLKQIPGMRREVIKTAAKLANTLPAFRLHLPAQPSPIATSLRKVLATI